MAVQAMEGNWFFWDIASNQALESCFHVSLALDLGSSALLVSSAWMDALEPFK